MAELSPEKQKLSDSVVNYLKSILTSVGGELPMRKVNGEYKKLIGTDIPHRDLNHGTLASLLQSYPEALTLINRGGDLYLTLARSGNKDLGFVLQQVQEQNKNTKRKVKQKPARHPRNPSAWVPSMPYGVPRPNQQFLGNSFSRPSPWNVSGQASQQRNTNKPRNLPKPNHPPNFTKPNQTSAPNIPQPNTAPKQDNFAKAFSLPSHNGTEGKQYSKPIKTGQFYNDGVRQLPRATRFNQEKQFAPYYEVPPRFCNIKNGEGNLDPDKKTCKQQLEEEVRKLNIGEMAVFRTIPWGKKQQFWISTVTIGKHKISSYPDEKAKPEDAEELVAKKALEEVQKMLKDSYPTTVNMELSIQRVKELLRKENNCVLWWSALQELYQQSFSEKLPDNWPEHVRTRDPSIKTDNPLGDRWTLQLVEKTANPDDAEKFPKAVDMQLAIQRIKELLKKQNSHSMWWTALQELYIQNFRENLPNNWLLKLQTQDPSIKAENPFQDRWTLQLMDQATDPVPPPYRVVQDSHKLQNSYFPHVDKVWNNSVQSEQSQTGRGYPLDQDHRTNVEVQSTEIQSPVDCGGNVADLSMNEQPRLPKLQLPYANYWDVYVTYIEDLTRVQFRLVGDSHSYLFDELLTSMELYYMEEKNLSPVKCPSIDGIYAANFEESWYRVQVLKMSGNNVTVRFLDHGDIQDMEMSNLHHLQKKFFELPPQHVECSLAGLEYAKKNPDALALLQELALGQTLVAQVVSRAKPLSLILFNTATDDDININQKISEHLDVNFVEPTLPEVGGVTEVYLMHVTSSGDVYVQVETETYRLLENLLEMARSRTEEILGEKMQIDLTRLYLARFSEDGEWYRAAPRGGVDPDGKVLMRFVDFGNTDRVPTTNIRHLNSVFHQLSKIPQQALQCRLYNVPSTPGLKWTNQACRRLVELTPSPDDSPLLLKVQAGGENGGPPFVELFKRLKPQNELVSINATLALDSGLFSEEGDSNNNTVVVSPTRMKLRHHSSSSYSTGKSSPCSTSSQYSSSSSSLQSSSTSRPESPVLPVIKPPEIPAYGLYYDIFVTFAASPSNFVVQSYKMACHQTAMMKKIQNYYEDIGNHAKSVDIHIGGYYAVKHTDNIWYRGNVNSIQHDMVTGLYVDYGDCFVVSRDSIQPLHPDFYSMPCQAIKAKMHGIVPANRDWSPEDTCRFQSLVEYQEFVSVVMGFEKDENGAVVLSLVLIDTRDDDRDVDIGEILVEEGRAIKEE